MSSDPLGKNPGQPSDLSSMGLSNSYTDIPDISVDAIADRVQPRQVPTGTSRGVQAVGGIDVRVDSGKIQFFVQDTVNQQQGVFGLTPDGTLALVITKPGYTIEDAITPDD